MERVAYRPMERVDNLLREKNAEIGNLKKENEELKRNVKDELSKCENLTKELQETKAALLQQSNKVIVTLEDANKSSSEASKKVEFLQDLLSQRTAEINYFKDKLQQPSSLRKDNNSAAVDRDVETNEPEVNQYNAYESPLTSLTEVAGKVTVSFLSNFPYQD